MLISFFFIHSLRKSISEGKPITPETIRGMFEAVNSQGFFTINLNAPSESEIEKCFEEFDLAKKRDHEIVDNDERQVQAIFNTISTNEKSQKNDTHRFIMKMRAGEKSVRERVLGPARETVNKIMRAYGDFTGVKFEDSQNWVSLVSEPRGQIQSLHTDWASSVKQMELMAKFGAKTKVVPLSCIFFAQEGAIAINQGNIYDSLGMYQLEWVNGNKPLLSSAPRRLINGKTKTEMLQTNERVLIGTAPFGCQVIYIFQNFEKISIYTIFFFFFS